MEVRRKVLGESTIVTEDIKQVIETKNTITERLTRKTVKAIVLDCGHKIPVTKFNKVPTNNTRCIECERLA